MPSKSGRARRSVYLGFAVVLLMLGLRPAAPSAREGTSQGPFFVSGRNVNTVGLSPAPGTPNPGLVGDPLFKQQNEVDCDVSPNDSRLVFCANNDYRGIEGFGDSWIGVTMSDDGGLTWKSRLHPGFPATTGTGVGAADPVVATVPGLGLVGFITISRTDNRGTLRLGRWLERNKENGERYTHLDTVVIGSGTPGRFADKPAMVAVLTSAGLAGGLTTVGDRAVPSGVIHFGYAIFPGNANNSASEIYHLMSTDYGATWSNPKKLSESIGINQGIDFAVDGTGRTVVATWRRVKDTNEPDAIMFARSTDGGKTWSKASVLSLGTFFDQDSSDLQFRTRSMPSIVHDGTAFHVFWSARGMATNAVDARVVVSSSTDGATWPASPTPVDNHTGRGHQLMPTAAVAGGRVQVNWIDSRNNAPDSFGPTLADIVYDNPASASGKSVYRQSVDVFAVQAPSGAALTFGNSQQVSRYRMGIVSLPGPPPTRARGQLEYNFVNARMFKLGAWPFHGDYHVVAGQRYRPNPDPNPENVKAMPWVPNTTSSDSHAVFYSAFTDNRDVRGYVWAGPTNTSFTPTVTQEAEPGVEVPVACAVTQPAAPDADLVWAPGNSPRSRDQNVYAAATLPGLLVESPSGSKPTGNLGRAYVVTVYNLTDRTTNYQLSIANQPAGGSASWARCETGPCSVDSIVSTIARRSSISRTVYVVSTELRPRIVVSVAEQAPLAGPTAQTGSVILNADPNAPQIEQPEGNLAQIIDQELYQPAILTRQVTSYSTALLNPDVVPVWSTGTAEAPRIDYPRIDYPRIDYPRIDYPRIDYSSPTNPRIDYPRIDYPRIDYQSVENPRIDYSALSSDTVTEITWPVTTSTANPATAANTTTAMTAMVFVNGGLPAGTEAQLLVTVPYTTGVANSCFTGDSSTLVDNQVIVNYIVENPGTLAATPDGVPDVVNPNPWQPSFPVKPGQTVWVTLRIRGIDGGAGELLANRTGLWVRAQPDTAANNGVDEARDGVIDLTAPQFSTTNPEVLGTGEATGPAGGVVTYDLPAATDAVDKAPVVACTPVSGSSFALGPSTVNCTATDASLNSTTAPFKVMVVDTTPPIVTVPADISTKEATGSGGAVVTFSVTASDIVDPTPTIACVPASGSTFSLGTTTVTCTAKDAAGNISAPSSFTVAVRDVTPPVLTVPANMTVNAASSGTVVVSYAPTATDAVDPTPTIACVPASRSMFSVGTTTVTCTAKDAAGNISAPSSFTVTVRDVTPPVIVEAATPTILIWSPNKIMTPVRVYGSITDATTVRATYAIVDEYKTYSTAGETISVAPDGTYSFTVSLEAWRTGTDSDGRTYTIIVTAVDGAGNTASKSVVVKVPHNS